MSRGLGAPVIVQSRTPKVAASTVNSTYFPLTRKLVPTLLASTILFCSPDSPKTENPPPWHAVDEAEKPGTAIKLISSPPITGISLRHQTKPKPAPHCSLLLELRIVNTSA